MGPIFIALAMLAQAGAAPSPDEEPRTEATREAPRLPFETGQVVFRVEIRMNGAVRCTAEADRAAFAASAARLCTGMPALSPGEAEAGDLISRVTTAVTVTRAGDAPPALPTSPDPRSYDTQAEIEVHPDGSVGACRVVNETRSAESAVPVQTDGICDDLLRSRPFRPGLSEDVRRGAMRLTIFSAGPDRLRQQ